LLSAKPATALTANELLAIAMCYDYPWKWEGGGRGEEPVFEVVVVGGNLLLALLKWWSLLEIYCWTFQSPLMRINSTPQNL
jgi:hypothetical protein